MHKILPRSMVLRESPPTQQWRVPHATSSDICRLDLHIQAYMSNSCLKFFVFALLCAVLISVVHLISGHAYKCANSASKWRSIVLGFTSSMPSPTDGDQALNNPSTVHHCHNTSTASYPSGPLEVSQVCAPEGRSRCCLGVSAVLAAPTARLRDACGRSAAHAPWPA